MHTCPLFLKKKLPLFSFRGTSIKLHKIFSEVSSVCRSSDADLCPQIQENWKQIFGLVSKVHKSQIIPDPILIILGPSENSTKLLIPQQQLLSYGIPEETL